MSKQPKASPKKASLRTKASLRAYAAKQNLQHHFISSPVISGPVISSPVISGPIISTSQEKSLSIGKVVKAKKYK